MNAWLLLLEGTGEQKNLQARSAEKQTHHRVLARVPPAPAEAKALQTRGGGDGGPSTEENGTPMKTRADD